MIGILAYGSLVTHPGYEIESVLDHVIPNIVTPFTVEYARCSRKRANAPTLVPVPDGCGAPVKAVVLVLQEGIKDQDVMNMLYRREINHEGELNRVYDEQTQMMKNDPLMIKILENEYSLPIVYYTKLKANFKEILDPYRTVQEKAEILAQSAIDSVTSDTYKECIDGIQYLADNINVGVVTALTGVYQQAILKNAGIAPELVQARQFFARQKGIIL